MSEPINERGEPLGAPRELSDAKERLSQISGEPMTEQGLEPGPYRQATEQMRKIKLKGGIFEGFLGVAVGLALVGPLLGGKNLGEIWKKYGKDEFYSWQGLKKQFNMVKGKMQSAAEAIG